VFCFHESEGGGTVAAYLAEARRLKVARTTRCPGIADTAAFLAPDCLARSYRVNGGPTGPSHAIGSADH